MKKRNLFSIVAVIALCAVVAVGSTLAYLYDTADEVTNTFTYNGGSKGTGLEITLEEENWDPDVASNITTNLTIPKDPVITNTGSSGDAYIAAIIKIPKGFDDFAELRGASTEWGYYYKAGTNEDYIYAYYKGDGSEGSDIVTAGTDLPALFEEVYIKQGDGIPAKIPATFDILVSGYAAGTAADDGYAESSFADAAYGYQTAIWYVSEVITGGWEFDSTAAPMTVTGGKIIFA